MAELSSFEGAFIVIKESLAIFPASEYSKVADLVKNHLVRNQKTPEDLFNCLNNKSPKRSIDNILLGFCLEHGIGTIPNLTKAFLEYQKAAKAKDSFGQFFLGYCYNNGIGTSQDRGKTFELYSKAAEAGHTIAQTNLATCYLNGWGTTKNLEKAFELYSKAAETGHTNAQTNIALCYHKGCGTTKNLEKAFELYSKAAEAGDPGAQFNLALRYDNGCGTTKNLEKAFELYSEAAETGDINAQTNLATCYLYGEGTTKNLEKAFELYSKAAEAGSLLGQMGLRIRLETTEDLEKVGNPSPQTSIGTYYRNGWGTMRNPEKTFEFWLKTAEAGNQNAQYNLGWCYQNGWGTTKNLEKAFKLYLKAAEANRSDFPCLNVHNLTLEDQDNPEYNILRFQNRGFKYRDNLKGEFLDFEAFFDQLSDEFKCFKCGKLDIIISGSPICPFCDTDKSDDTFKAVLPKCLECYRALKDPLWCGSCETSRFSQIWDTWKSGNHNIDQYILYTQRNSENCRGCLEWISPDEIEFLDKVGVGGFGIVKEGRWKNGRILFWDNKIQKYERTGVTKFIAHLTNASCKYILECYGITKDIITDEFIMVLPFAEHGDLRAFLKMNENTLTWEMFLRILFQIVSGLRFIHDSNLVHGDLHPGNILVLKSNSLKVAIADLGLCRPANYSPQPGEIFGVVRYLAPEICNLSPHTKYSDIYSCAIISWEIISGERPWNGIKDPMSIQLYTIQGRRLPIQKHTPQCIQEMIEKNWDDKPHSRDSAEEIQQRVIAARDNCNLNESIGKKRFNYKTIQGANHDKSQKISSPLVSENELDLAFNFE
ncbi:hypothetical protein G9A89_012333 [Geosiphon pyriformis]|nr:hypothetical protein G9A89_012333 [Geosiphon pyriformis]